MAITFLGRLSFTDFYDTYLKKNFYIKETVHLIRFAMFGAVFREKQIKNCINLKLTIINIKLTYQKFYAMKKVFFPFYK